MIYNRSKNDVENARRIIEEKIKKFQSTTQTDDEILERGTITINTLNRIETKQSELRKSLNSMGYYDINITNKKWNVGDVFLQGDFDRIIENNSKIRRGFYVFKDSPIDAVSKFHYQEINSIEKILNDVEQNIEITTQKYKICGTFNAGGD